MSQYPITLTGRLTRDPILTKTSTGAYKAKLRVASSRRIPDRQVDAGANDPEGHNSKAPQWRDVDHLYIDVEMWNQFAINVRKSLAKGMPLVIVGSLVTEQWRDDQGTDHFRTFIKAQPLPCPRPPAKLEWRRLPSHPTSLPDTSPLPPLLDGPNDPGWVPPQRPDRE
mgnify:CR=1 FL=1